MDVKAYSDMIHNIVVPATLSQEEMFRCYQPLIDFLQTETPEKLYRFRQCNENSIAAFDQDQLWVSPGYKMNDDFDALLHFDKESIKSELKAFLGHDQFIPTFQAIGKGAEVPVHIQNILPPEMIEAVRSTIAQLDEATINKSISQLYDFFVNQIDANDVAVQQIIQKAIKFACFSEAIESAAMWGYYADSGRGFALSYDFRNGGYTMCNLCPTGNQCPSYKSCSLAPVIYSDTCFDATKYAAWLFQQEAILRILADRNALSVYSLLQNIVPCPDLFMPVKILLHKAKAWEHEREWRLICQCNSSEFIQQEFSYAKKEPTAVYLGRKISPFYEKVLRHIAIEKNIPVYKMQIQRNDTSYKLHPEKLS